MVRADAGNTRRPNTSPFYKGLVINNYKPDNNYIRREERSQEQGEENRPVPGDV